MSKNIKDLLSTLLADTYALFLKTQNYHWHVKGPSFKTLHELFEEQYTELFQFVDDIAERILTLGYNAPANFSEFEAIKTLKDGDSSLTAEGMVVDLANDREKLLKDLLKVKEVAESDNDEGTLNLLSDLIATHEKSCWMLRASI